MNNFFLIVIGFLFSFYGIICAIECGSSLSLINPKFSSNSKSKTFTPDAIWQIINILVLVTALVSYLLVNKTYLAVNGAVKALLVIGFISLLIKYLISTSVYKNKRSNLKNIYSLMCYLVPLSFGAIGIYAITGKDFWLTFVGWTLMTTILLGLTVVGLSFANREKLYLKRTLLRQYIDGLFCVWAVVLGFVYPIALQHYNSTLITTSLSILEVVIIVGVIGYAVTAIKQKKSYELYQYAILIGVLAPLLLALNNRPYFITLKITLAQTFRLNSYTHSVSWLTYVLFILIIATTLFSIYALGRILKIWDLVSKDKLTKKTSSDIMLTK